MDTVPLVITASPALASIVLGETQHSESVGSGPCPCPDCCDLRQPRHLSLCLSNGSGIVLSLEAAVRPEGATEVLAGSARGHERFLGHGPTGTFADLGTCPNENPSLPAWRVIPPPIRGLTDHKDPTLLIADYVMITGPRSLLILALSSAKRLGQMSGVAAEPGRLASCPL